MFKLSVADMEGMQNARDHNQQRGAQSSENMYLHGVAL